MDECEFRKGKRPATRAIDHLFIAIPSCRDWKAHFGMSLVGLLSDLHSRQQPHMVEALMGSSLLPAARQRAIERALDAQASHILMLDDDMVFTPRAFWSLAGWHSVLRDSAQPSPPCLIAANYISKGPGGAPVAVDLKGERISSLDKPGIEKVGTIGLGFALLDLAALEKIALPWFEVSWVDDKGFHMGEDAYFCKLLAHSGIPVLVDHAASAHIGHVGDHVYSEKDLGDGR